MPDRGTRGRDAAQGFNVVRVFPETIHHAIVDETVVGVALVDVALD